jgi:hypothetical protein
MKTGNKYYFFLLFFIFATNILLINKSYSNQKSISVIPRLNKEKALELAKYSLQFLNENKGKVVGLKNESGFIRITIPTAQFEKWGIDKIRLNYWSPENDIDIEPESIHNHPRYFESFIVHGGYTHAKYKFSQDKKNENRYKQYRLYKGKQDKYFEFKGVVQLKHLENESVKSGMVNAFPLSLIHRVLSTEVSTLSLNVLYDSNKNENEEKFYDVFISSEAHSSEHIKTKREFLTQQDTTKCVKKIIQLLEQFIVQDDK